MKDATSGTELIGEEDRQEEQVVKKYFKIGFGLGLGLFSASIIFMLATFFATVLGVVGVFT